MKAVNIRQLHERTGALVDLAAEGHPIVILRRGTPIAELRSASLATHRRTLPDRRKLLARYPRLEGDSGRFLEQDRS
jgi:antitoxin (DNA-binding transcriptional repressor) of toxin-antitoxin stability system